MRYRAEIDGFRALAVVPVILFHAGFELFSGGFVGVDVFFVISGYLITSIIIAEKEAGTFNLLNFYERRARRILPALFFVTAICIPFAWMLLLPSDLKSFAQSLIAVSTFSSNILFWRESGYFGTATEFKPLLHTWSLAVEEQYYVLFPLFLMLTWRLGKRWILAMLVVVFVLSLGVAHWGAYNQPYATFYLLPTRGWEILIGIFVAFHLQKRSDKSTESVVNQLASLVGFSLIVYAIFSFDRQTPFPSLYTLVPTIGAALMILYAVKGTLVNVLLSNKALVAIGLISYSAYLWQQPLFAFTNYRSMSEPPELTMLALCIATLPLAYLSWRYVEKPFRSKYIFKRTTVFALSIVGTITFVAFGYAGTKLKGFENRSVASKFMVLDYQPDNKVLQQQSWSYLRALNDADVEYKDLISFDLSSNKKRILLIGNSYSKDLYNVLRNSRTVVNEFQIARYGTGIHDLSDEVFSFPNYIHSDIVVIVSRYEENDFANTDWFIERVFSDGKSFAIVRNFFEFDGYGDRNLADLLIQKTLRNNDTVNETFVTYVNKAYFNEFSTPNNRRGLPAMADRQIDDLKMRYPKVIVMDPMDYICTTVEKLCFALDLRLNKSFYDQAHHTIAGAKYFGDRIDRINWLSDWMTVSEE